ncbi:MAG: NrsF family protein [Rhodobacterales bacterium]
MKTDDLLSVLSADTVPQPTVGQRMARALPVAFGFSVAAFLLFWGLRPDLGAALGSPAVLKTMLPALFAVLATGLAFALAHPGLRADRRSMALGMFAAALAAALVTLTVLGGLSGLINALVTPSLAVCLLSIPVLALPFLGAALWALSTGATLHPRLSGAVAGLMAGGAAATVYSLYCDQDAALFALPAYSAAILFVGLVGALAGPRLLRW